MQCTETLIHAFYPEIVKCLVRQLYHHFLFLLLSPPQRKEITLSVKIKRRC